MDVILSMTDASTSFEQQLPWKNRDMYILFLVPAYLQEKHIWREKAFGTKIQENYWEESLGEELAQCEMWDRGGHSVKKLYIFLPVIQFQGFVCFD